MEQKSYKVSAPGSLMITGEHAVLYAKTAIVASINKRITVELIPIYNLCKKNTILINSQDLGIKEFDFDNVNITKPFEFVSASILFFIDKIKIQNQGFELKIQSDFDSTCGLGSSAAITVATVGVLSAYLLETRLTEQQLLHISKEIILQVQGMGSGADLAACIYGGIISYTIKEGMIEKLPSIKPGITLVYTGYKKKTAEVINLIKDKYQLNKKEFDNIFIQMDIAANKAIAAIKEQNWVNLSTCFKTQQILLEKLGVSDQIIDNIINKLYEYKNIIACKISGSGLGDCVLALGKDKLQNDFHQICIDLGSVGINYE